MMKKISALLGTTNRDTLRANQSLVGIGVVVLVAIIGTTYLLVSHAASTSVAIEPEAGTISGSATLVSDSTTSGGGYIHFGSTGCSGDCTPPVVSITAPASGATVSGSTTISATASDNVGVTKVEFYVNNVITGAAVTASPYSMSWNAGTAANTYTLTAKAYDAAGNVATSAPVSVSVGGSGCGTSCGGTVTIAAAGDISGQTANDANTAKLISGKLSSLAAILVLGDLQYPDGQNYSGYNSTWGAFKSKTKPTPGNHDYKVDGGKGYYAYWSGNPKYYSYDLGSWHLVSLNSQEDISSTGAEVAWLKSDLAAHPAKCTLAYTHYPRYSSPGTGKHGDITTMQPIWQALYDANADVTLAGHDHVFESFSPKNPSGGLDAARGITSFVVGTGGGALDPVGTPETGSQGGISTWGVMFMDLQPSSYTWQFIGINGQVLKSGSGSCH